MKGKRTGETATLSTNRRKLLLGFGAAAGGSLAAPLVTASGAAERNGQEHVADAPVGHGAAGQRQPFHGYHQPGIVTPRPAAGMIVAFDVVAQRPADLERLLRALSERIAFLMQGGKVPEWDPKLPPPDSGILGPEIEPDNLTVTVGLGASLFERHEWLKPHRPKQLQRMVQFRNDALESELCHGDLSLQFCANSQDTNIHALRDIVKNLSEFMVLRWKQEGGVPVVQAGSAEARHSARNFLGFHDGSANPDSTDEALMRRMVWVGENAGEPDWAVGGSYQVIRIIRNFVERWDRTPLGEQERIIGRKKMTGAPLDGDTEFDVPDFAADPHGKVTPLDAHIRLANPRTPATQQNLILRRAFNYSNGVSKSGQLEQGLLFICYQADLEKGFITVQNRLAGEPLSEYIQPVGGGYFYALPGAVDDTDYVGRKLIAAIAAAPTDRS